MWLFWLMFWTAFVTGALWLFCMAWGRVSWWLLDRLHAAANAYLDRYVVVHHRRHVSKIKRTGNLLVTYQPCRIRLRIQSHVLDIEEWCWKRKMAEREIERLDQTV